jgi:hypothetical protein
MGRPSVARRQGRTNIRESYVTVSSQLSATILAELWLGLVNLLAVRDPESFRHSLQYLNYRGSVASRAER